MAGSLKILKLPRERRGQIRAAHRARIHRGQQRPR